MASQVIVLGGGLAGLSAAHTVLEHGGRVLLLDKARSAARQRRTRAPWRALRASAARPRVRDAAVRTPRLKSAAACEGCATACEDWRARALLDSIRRV